MTLDIITYAGALVFPGIDKKGVIARHLTALHDAFLSGQRLVSPVS